MVRVPTVNSETMSSRGSSVMAPSVRPSFTEGPWNIMSSPPSMPWSE